MRRVYNVTSKLKQNERPLVFAEQAAGLDPTACCRAFGNFNFGEFVSEAGGLNWGSKFFSGVSGMVNPEKIVVDDPAFLLMTGANWSNSNPGQQGCVARLRDQGSGRRRSRSKAWSPVRALPKLPP